MISFNIGDGRFNLRAAGVYVEDGYVLLHRADVDDWWSLPGGRVEIGESSEAALQRELVEEMGSEAGTRVGRLLWIIENTFTLEDTPQHEVGFYYQFSCIPGDSWHDRGRIHIGREEQMKLFFK